MHHNMSALVSLSTPDFMKPPALPNFLIKLTRSVIVPVEAYFCTCILFHVFAFHLESKQWFWFFFFFFTTECYNCKLTSRKQKSSQRLSLFHRVPPENRSSACSVLHHPCCTSGFLYSVLLIRWTHKTGPRHHPPPTNRILFWRGDIFLKWVTKKLQDESFWHDRLNRSWATVT